MGHQNILTITNMAPAATYHAPDGRKNGDLHRDYIDDRNSSSQDTLYTTSNGVPYPHPYETQRVGENGPLLLQDFHLIDLLSHFDRERIPERVVHAKGGGAHGYYQTTDPMDDLCMADIFQAGKKCPISVRFSTVGGESGSHDCARDPRGFSVKFRTDEGNWDMVANNTPVFFLRDPAKFPHFIHTQKRHPATHLTHADDSTMFWDYLSQNPESVHQVMILMGDRGIPDGWRKMHGYAGHTQKLVNKNGDWVYGQMHMKSKQGTGFITQEDSANYSPDYAQKDLYNAIEKGDYPGWDVCWQTMTPKQAEELWENQRINIFDLTHVWPHDQFPLRKVGEFYLNENVQNYFAEIEQIAFNPSHLPPGIEPSADPVLQSRLFSYPDTHRHRVGVNYQQRFINNVSGHMSNCTKEEIIKRQIAIFREVSEDIASRLEKATGVKGYPGIAGLSFNGTHNGMANDDSKRFANGLAPPKKVGSNIPDNNGAPRAGTHKGSVVA